MKTQIAKLSLFAILSIAGTTMALAHENNIDAGTNHWISHIAASKNNQLAANQQDPQGYATSGPVSRVLSIDSGTKYLNVTRLETVQINFEGKSVIWTFDTLGTGSFSLSKIIPGATGVTVYIAENPLYRHG